MDTNVTALLQRANLVQYEASLLEQGADDLQQLMEISEEELQGLVKAIGMDVKPFHVMRFRKALGRHVPGGVCREDGLANFGPGQIPPTVTVFASRIDPLSMNLPTDPSSIHGSNVCYNPTSSLTPAPSSTVTISSSPGPPPSSTINISPVQDDGEDTDTNCRKVVQIEVSVQQLEQIVDESAPVQLRLGPSPISPDVWDAGRKDLIRSSSQVFLSSNSRRRGHDLTEHESFINEAAYQLCLWDPTLLVRREELLSLAKKLVRESGTSGTIQVKYSMSTNPRLRSSPYPLQRGTDGKFKACFELNFDLREKQIVEVERLLAENVAEEQVKQVLLSEAKRQKDYSSVLQLQEEIATLGQTYRQLRTQLSKVKRKQRRSVRHQEIKRMRNSGENDTSLTEKYSSLQLPMLPPELAQELSDTAAIVSGAVTSATASDDSPSSLAQVQTTAFADLGMNTC